MNGEPLPERRRDPESRDRIDQLELDLEGALNRIGRFVRKIAIALVVLLVAQLALGAWDVKLSDDNAARIRDIQGSRLDQCRSTNRRHDQTVARLKAQAQAGARTEPAQLAKLFGAIGLHVTPAQEKALGVFELSQVPLQVARTTALIDSLAPKKDCQAALALKH